MTNREKTTFWSFLTSFSICIPIIQRDYAQGRIGKEELRKRFIFSLNDSISNKKPLPLDFAYGKFSGSGKNRTFFPLDGQQRLTTLWLLHWYVAYKANKLQVAKTVLQKFSYATRVSARDFCKKLCNLPPLPEGASDILLHIQNQNWFYSLWNQDPTIQSMLRMISDTDKRTGIVELLDLTNYEDVWIWLTGQDCKMEFRVLDIAEIGQTDDLYVKMNARGKALSSFENFKAELVDYIHKKAEDNANPDQASWKKLDKPEDGFGQKLDNAWTDIFWKLKSTDETRIGEFQYRIDEIFFAFFNRYFFNCQALKAGANWDKSPLYRNNDGTLVFSSLKNYCIPPCSRTDRDCGKCESVNIPLDDVFRNIQKVLDRWPKLAKILVVNPERCPNPPLGPSWDKASFFFLPNYVHDEKNNNLVPVTDDDGNDILAITNITIKQRAAFFAICRWLSYNEPDVDSYSEKQKEHFQDWLRVVWNIVENSDTEGDLPGALNLINELAGESCDILSFLAQRDNKIKSKFAQDILKEERSKATIILARPELKDVIEKELESHPFIHGDIPVQIYTPAGEQINPETWRKRHGELVKYLEQGEYKFSKDLLMHLKDYSQLEFCFVKGDFVFNQENYHRLIRNPGICKVIAEMLDGAEEHLFAWPDHEPTVKRICQRLAKEKTLDVFMEKGFKETRLQWRWDRLYLHKRGAHDGYFLLNSPLYEILDWLIDKGKIGFPDGQKWSGVFHYDPVTFLFQNIQFCSDGTTIWVDGCSDSSVPLFTGTRIPVCDFRRCPACEFSEDLANKFLECCQRVYDKHCKNVAAEQDEQGGQE